MMTISVVLAPLFHELERVDKEAKEAAAEHEDCHQSGQEGG
jgi:hypothetical protein